MSPPSVAGIALAALTLVVGLFVAGHSQRRAHTPGTAGTLADPYVFLIFPVTTVGMFAVFVALGALNRKRPDTHKRFMLLGTLTLIVPALARLFSQIAPSLGITGVPGVVGALIIADMFLIALVAHDLSSRGRLHPVTLWGGGVLLLSEPLRFVVGFSAPWQAFAQYVMS